MVFQVSFDGDGLSSVALIEIPSRFSGLLWGLCGDYDGLPDDLKTKDGRDLTNDVDKFYELAESFVVDENQNGLDG